MAAQVTKVLLERRLAGAHHLVIGTLECLLHHVDAVHEDTIEVEHDRLNCHSLSRYPGPSRLAYALRSTTAGHSASASVMASPRSTVTDLPSRRSLAWQRACCGSSAPHAVRPATQQAAGAARGPAVRAPGRALAPRSVQAPR